MATQQKQPLPTNPLLGLDLNALFQMQQQAQQAPGGPLRSYAPGFGPQDNLFGEQGAQRQTNNPNAVPVGGGGLDPALRRIVEQNMGTGRLDISGNRVDPLKPTGLDWLEDNAGRGQVHSWDQPQYPNLGGNQAVERSRLADINRANTEQSVFDPSGFETRMTPYGPISNAPMGRDIPEGGSQRLPMKEGQQLAQNLNTMFNQGSAQPPMTQTPYGPPSSQATPVDIFARDDDPVTKAARDAAMKEALQRQQQRGSQPAQPALPPVDQIPQNNVFASSQMQNTVPTGVRPGESYEVTPDLAGIIPNITSGADRGLSWLQDFFSKYFMGEPGTAVNEYGVRRREQAAQQKARQAQPNIFAPF